MLRLILTTYLSLFLAWAIIPRHVAFFYYYYPAGMVLSLALAYVARPFFVVIPRLVRLIGLVRVAPQGGPEVGRGVEAVAPGRGGVLAVRPQQGQHGVADGTGDGLGGGIGNALDQVLANVVQRVPQPVEVASR